MPLWQKSVGPKNCFRLCRQFFDGINRRLALCSHLHTPFCYLILNPAFLSFSTESLAAGTGQIASTVICPVLTESTRKSPRLFRPMSIKLSSPSSLSRPISALSIFCTISAAQLVSFGAKMCPCTETVLKDAVFQSLIARTF